MKKVAKSLLQRKRTQTRLPKIKKSHKTSKDEGYQKQLEA